ncbi:energy transducer TonB [Alteromonas macleodii]|uniref:energy transducer TonB n=1 Tax=Alteromonas macleodii TaxID=28108 RepID=UPI0031405E4B
MFYKASLFSLCLLSAGSFADTIYGTVELTHLTPTQAESTWQRENQVVPRYPMKLAQKGIAGCGIFKVNVDAEGTTKSIMLVNSVPKRVIEKPAARVIEEWDWTLVEGKSAASEEKLIRLDFCLGASSEEEAHQLCKQQASMACE